VAGNPIRITIFAAGCLAASTSWAELTAEELAKLAQNPVGNLISLPFQNNTNLNFGPEKERRTHHHAHDRAGDLESGAQPRH